MFTDAIFHILARNPKAVGIIIIIIIPLQRLTVRLNEFAAQTPKLRVMWASFGCRQAWFKSRSFTTHRSGLNCVSHKFLHWILTPVLRRCLKTKPLMRWITKNEDTAREWGLPARGVAKETQPVGTLISQESASWTLRNSIALVKRSSCETSPLGLQKPIQEHKTRFLRFYRYSKWITCVLTGHHCCRTPNSYSWAIKKNASACFSISG